MGKCVAFDTPIVDPATGDLRTAAELHRAGTAGDDVDGPDASTATVGST